MQIKCFAIWGAENELSLQHFRSYINIKHKRIKAYEVYRNTSYVIVI